MARLIIGHTTHNSVKIWVRGSARWPVAFLDVRDSAGRRKGQTQSLFLLEDSFYTGIIYWSNLSPNRPYTVHLSFAKTEDDSFEDRVRDAYTTGRFTTFPIPDAKSEFSFLLGSCNLHVFGALKNPDSVWMRVSEVSNKHTAKFMIHCGDQIYADIPFAPDADPDFYRNKYLDAWEDCYPARRFLSARTQYMILDDHEISDNFDNGSLNTRYSHALKRVAIQAYNEFQHSHNPDTANDPVNGRQYFYSFNYGKTPFFVLDTRTERNASKGQMISRMQLNCLKNWLGEHASNTKFVVTSVPFVTQRKTELNDKWCSTEFNQQRYEILDYLLGNNIGKTIFLTGDMHASYHATMTVKRAGKTLTIHELMSSPLNQFTPTKRIEDDFISPHDTTLHDLELRSRITLSSFYGNHSNVMCITVKNSRVGYKIYRTTQKLSASVSKSFQP